MFNGPEPFDCEGDPLSLGSRWEKWKRGLQIYLLASSVDTPVKKRATLLHTGGLALQEIYYNVPGAEAEPTDSTGKEVDVYDIAVKKLDEYFAPKQSFVYERHMFRLIKQEEGEIFHKFLIRLRNQCSKCEFSTDDNLIDQITEKCRSSELRKKILMLGDTITVDQIIMEAKTLETVERQLSDFQKPPQNLAVNKIENSFNRFSKPMNTFCTRCGSSSHKADSITCKARDAVCKKCGFRGHFIKQCRTRPNKRKTTDATQVNKTRMDEDKAKKAKTENTTIDYIFHLDEDETVKCQIGGVEVNMLIDSGTKCNIITDQTWEHLEACAVEATNQQKSTERMFKAYGSTEPLTILGAFEARIRIGDGEQGATFYVIKNGTRDLLGKETAIYLNVLRMG